MSKELLKRAKEALEALERPRHPCNFVTRACVDDQVAKGLRTAIEQAEQAQPVYQYRVVGGGWKDCSRTLYEQFSKEPITTRVLYTHPQPSKLLSYEQIGKLVDTYIGGPSPSYPLDQSSWIDFTRAVEAAHGINERTAELTDSGMNSGDLIAAMMRDGAGS